MKKALIAPLLAAALLIPGLAGAATNNLAGDVDPSGTVSMTVKKKNGHVKVVNFAFSHVPMTCNSGQETTSGTISSYAFKVNDDNKFGATLTNGQQPPSTLKVTGKLLQHGKAAKGTIRLQGATARDPYPSGGNGSNCDSGKRPWAASKVP